MTNATLRVKLDSIRCNEEGDMLMNVFCHNRHLLHLPRRELEDGEWVENPDKPDRIELLKQSLSELDGIEIVHPRDFDESTLLLVHDSEYLGWMRMRCDALAPDKEYFPEVFGYDRMFDTGTPLMKNSLSAALDSVSTALSALEDVVNGNRVAYALSRPPGHHASKGIGGGYCYFNNAAIAARYFQGTTAARVSILDLDFHHFNGTQDIFYDDPTVFCVSLHGDPKVHYPWISGFEKETGEGEGKGYTMNIPLPTGTEGKEYKEALERALLAIENFGPELLIISLGTDTHAEDPIGAFSLVDEDYEDVAMLIMSLNLETLIVHEGGYNPQASARAATRFVKGVLASTG